MDTNLQNITTTTTTFTNLEEMETNEHNITVHHQNLMGSGIWPNYHIPSSTSGAVPSNSGFVNVATHFEDEEEPEEELGAMKEMMYKIAAMQPVDIDPASIRKPKRRNVRISDDPQSVAARHRRERISEKMRILQRLVPGGTKMDTASMLDEAIRYVKFLKRQIRLLQSTPTPQYSQPQPPNCNIATPTSTPSATFLLPTTGVYWPFAPNILHGGDGSSSSTFNHHEVISE